MSKSRSKYLKQNVFNKFYVELVHWFNRSSIYVFKLFGENIGAKKLRSNAFITAPGRYRKVEGT